MGREGRLTRTLLRARRLRQWESSGELFASGARDGEINLSPRARMRLKTWLMRTGLLRSCEETNEGSLRAGAAGPRPSVDRGARRVGP